MFNDSAKIAFSGLKNESLLTLIEIPFNLVSEIAFSSLQVSLEPL